MYESCSSRGSVFDLLSLPDDLRESCENAEIVVLPWKKPLGTESFAFPVGTTDYFQYFVDSVGDEHSVELASTDEEFNELAEHGEPVSLGFLLLTSLVFPTVSGLIVAWVTTKYLNRPDKPTIRTKLLVKKTDGTIAVWEYDGPPEQLEASLEAFRTNSLQLPPAQKSLTPPETGDD